MSKITYEEDIEEAVNHCSIFLGKSGRMLYQPSEPKPIKYNATISTPTMGILWYGDITEDDFPLVDMAQTAIGEPLNIYA